ncbi:MAG: M15 family metallopeptidase [Hyphomicrobiales bacterium]
MRRLAIFFAVLIGPGMAAIAAPAADRIEALIAAYPDHLAGREGNDLIWRDGTRMPIDDGRQKNHDDRLDDGDIEDSLSQVYPLGDCSFAPPAFNFEPGRIRSTPFFMKMYGASESAARASTTTIPWFDGRVRVTTVNGVDQRLQAVARDLAALGPKFRPFLNKSGGAFNWRVIAGTSRPSVHSFGAAIDIDTGFSDYWRWKMGKDGKVGGYANRIPREIVEVFEAHGFVWGGKWYHYDTMHFEYRPELIAIGQAEGRCAAGH